MSLSSLFLQLLAATTACIVIAGVADTLASRQMALSRYRWVPLIRSLRALHVLAGVLLAGALVTALVAAPLVSVIALQLSFIGVMATQGRALVVGAARHAWLSGIAPLTLLAVTTGNLRGLPLERTGTMALGSESLALALAAAAGFAWVGRQRLTQELIALRD